MRALKATGLNNANRKLELSLFDEQVCVFAGKQGLYQLVAGTSPANITCVTQPICLYKMLSLRLIDTAVDPDVHVQDPARVWQTEEGSQYHAPLRSPQGSFRSGDGPPYGHDADAQYFARMAKWNAVQSVVNVLHPDKFPAGLMPRNFGQSVDNVSVPMYQLAAICPCIVSGNQKTDAITIMFTPLTYLLRS